MPAPSPGAGGPAKGCPREHPARTGCGEGRVCSLKMEHGESSKLLRYLKEGTSPQPSLGGLHLQPALEDGSHARPAPLCAGDALSGPRCGLLGALPAPMPRPHTAAMALKGSASPPSRQSGLQMAPGPQAAPPTGPPPPPLEPLAAPEATPTSPAPPGTWPPSQPPRRAGVTGGRHPSVLKME